MSNSNLFPIGRNLNIPASDKIIHSILPSKCNILLNTHGFANGVIDFYGRLGTGGDNSEGAVGAGDPGDNYYPEASHGLSRFQYPDRRLVVSPGHLYGHEEKTDGVKFVHYLGGSMAMDSAGMLYGMGTCASYGLEHDNCSAFGMPHNSGDNSDGILGTPVISDETYEGGVKDFYFHYYYTHIISPYNELYVMGEDYAYPNYAGGSGMFNTGSRQFWPYITLVDFAFDYAVKSIIEGQNEGAIGGIVTFDNNIIAGGADADLGTSQEYDHLTATEGVDITDNLPEGVNIVRVIANGSMVMVLLADGTVGGKSFYAFMLGYDQSKEEGGPSQHEGIQILYIPQGTLIDIGISEAAAFAIDENYNLWVGGNYSYLNGVDDSPVGLPTPIPNGNFKQASYNSENPTGTCIDTDGNLITGGSGCHYGTQLGHGGTTDAQVSDILDVPVIDIAYTPTLADIEQPVCKDIYEPMTLSIKSIISYFIQTLPATFSEGDGGGVILNSYYKLPEIFENRPIIIVYEITYDNWQTTYWSVHIISFPPDMYMSTFENYHSDAAGEFSPSFGGGSYLDIDPSIEYTYEAIIVIFEEGAYEDDDIEYIHYGGEQKFLLEDLI